MNTGDSSHRLAPAEWNMTAAPYPAGSCIHHLVEEQAARTPGALAVIAEDQRLTYAELNRRANQVAHYLRSLGAGPETLVGICSTRVSTMLVGMLGILKAGAAYVALDPAYPRVRQAFMIEDANMPIVLTLQDLVENLPVTKAKLVCLDSDWGLIAQHPDTNPAVPMDPHNLAYILYTSGSTGRPKGVAIEHHSVVVFITWAHTVFPLDELQGTLAGTSICFDLSVFEIFVPWACGGAVILAENAVALPTLPMRHEVTLINTVPSAMTALINVGGVPPNVRVVNLAGEPLPNKLVQAIYDLGTVEKVYNLYGPSEDTTYSTFVLCPKGATKNPTIGRPISNTQVYIVDEKFEQMPVGVPGELCLGGDGLARGYLNRPDLTEAKFVPNPFGPGRLYRTGDLAAWLPDGEIEFMGRMDYQVKVRGFRIELGEVETALEQHPAVERAVVLALPDAHGELHLSGYVVANAGAVEELARAQDAQEHVALWRNVYEETYRQQPVSEDPTFNTSGWISSYTGQPIPSEEMREWLGQTIERILALHPRKVLELGCGTGMLLARVAPLCDSYVGIDISKVGLDHIRQMQKTLPGLENVTLLERSADELEDFARSSFDTIVINSVVQHFPDVEYLVRLLKDATRLIKPGGHILIGDVLNQALLETFHASVQIVRAAESETSVQVKQRIRQHVEQERDLMLAPGFFAALAQDAPGITHIQALPKRGRFQNQLTRFRYDAVLHVDDPAEPFDPQSWLDWQRQKLSVAEVRRRLTEERPEHLAIRNIPNARLDEELAAFPWLRESGPTETVGQLRAYLKQQRYRGIEPEDLWMLKELGYRVELSLLNSDANGAYDAVFTREDQPFRPALFAAKPAADAKRRSWQDFANHPHRAKIHRQLIPHVREFLEDKLPHYMMPSVFTVLEKLPLSPTGKIDRRALAALPVNMESPVEKAHSATLSPLEELLVQAWADALSVTFVGLDDNFFSLGGNSLSAMGLTHNLQKQLNRPLRPVVLLQHPTVAQFSAYLRETYPDLTLQAAMATAEMQEGEI